MSARVGIVVFPGTNCELDVAWAVEQLGGTPELLWHGERELRGADAVVVPGGFAHGDYLRTGAIARFSPVMDAVARFAAAGGPVVGICNGFQVLTEAGLLPGALQKNAGPEVPVRDGRVPGRDQPLCRSPRLAEPGRVLRLPINHFEGNYVCDDATARSPPRRRPGRAALRAQPERQPRRHRRRSATRAATSSGSCPTPSGRPTPLLGSADGVVLLALAARRAPSQGRAPSPS